jgi:tRNA pseudouridine32 synthase/23S rRNA pseudouridine746 synthase
MDNELERKQNVKLTCEQKDDGLLLVDVLARNCSLSKSLIKRLMVSGSVFQTFKGKRRNVRKAKYTVKIGDLIECYYDPSIDFDKEFVFDLIFETGNFGIYHKPVGALTEGTNYGDKSSLIRHVEKLKRHVFLINRLDRESEGLVVVAYNSKSQNLLQQIWRKSVVKKYQAIVLGKLEGSGSFEDKINDKFSKTSYSCVKTVGNKTYVEIELATERKNQIRIHFANNGNPVIGDPIFGEKNKNIEGLMLVSYCLEFIDPHTENAVKAELPKDRRLIY